MEAFNELTILFASLHMLIFTDEVPDPDLQYKFGWSIMAFMMFNFTVNIALIVRSSLRDLKKYLVAIILKVKRCRTREVKKYSIARTSMRRKNLYLTSVNNNINSLVTDN